MRISDHTRFPHPVLSENTTDYKGGDFSVDLQISESRTSGKITVQYKMALTEEALIHLLKKEQIMVGLYIICRRTYYNKLHMIKGGSGHIEFDKGELRDTVVFRPIICATQEISNFSSQNFHEEFSGIDWSFRTADVLALGTEVVIDVGLDKLAPMETIFNLVENNDIAEGETKILLDDHKIAICANEKTCKGIHTMRGSGVGKIALLNGVYLPAVMEVLAAISSESESHVDRRWYEILSAKCVHLGINLENVDPHADAQKLLRSPLGTMLNSKEFNPS